MIAITDINMAAADSMSEKENFISDDVSDNPVILRKLIEEIKEFCVNTARSNAFLVHIDTHHNKYVQIQTIGFGQANLGYRISDQPEGPWSDPVIFYEPQLEDQQDFVYSANAHPELTADGILITYNINNGDFGKLVNNENIYFPKFVRIKF